jgi:hypothetical protein
MAIPVPSNTTCDIYRYGNAPPAVPDVSNVKAFLAPDYPRGRESAEGDTSKGWTHLLLVDLDTDIRDGWSSGVPLQPGAYDRVYVPDKNGTSFSVIFVERLGRGTSADCKRIYLRREQPTYPTNEV